MKTIFITALLAAAGYVAQAQEEIPLYGSVIPNSKPAPPGYVEHIDSTGLTRNVTRPTLTVYRPDKTKATGTAVIICPGGGYAVLPTAQRNIQAAKAFTDMGITAFILKYRMPNDAVMVDKTIGPLQDGQTALLIIRKRAAEWGIDPHKIGFVGFSAGGHLASTVGTQFNRPVIENPEQISLRPDFMVLVYPVLLFDPAIPSGVRERLIGTAPSKAILDLYSSEKQVTAATPPSYLVHAADDDVVPVKNCLVFFDALVNAKVKASMHIYQAGGHGFGVENPDNKDNWPHSCRNWLTENGLLESASSQLVK
ncbi:alpha/beta hydrolase [Chitinophaga lutea]|uniref:Alpha/beta hydrolase n=1 Tax=Chitinophaga lutea TaxID=2488634 RepID=A0A3N4Q005_9BACT|nr:alpha/beta hydrolase [Chitinophaga lutea]RPE12499.1 alpha/beta hydrolase [Chitinophaga lutea]